MANQKEIRHKALTVTRIIYETMNATTVTFEQARDLGLDSYQRARRAADRIIAESQK